MGGFPRPAVHFAAKISGADLDPHSPSLFSLITNTARAGNPVINIFGPMNEEIINNNNNLDVIAFIMALIGQKQSRNFS
jgi:hypothetical protein